MKLTELLAESAREFDELFPGHIWMRQGAAHIRVRNDFRSLLLSKQRAVIEAVKDELEILNQDAEAVCVLASDETQRNIMNNILKPLGDLLSRLKESLT